jgi:hypothetical protein
MGGCVKPGLHSRILHRTLIRMHLPSPLPKSGLSDVSKCLLTLPLLLLGRNHFLHHSAATSTVKAKPCIAVIGRHFWPAASTTQCQSRDVNLQIGRVGF